AVGAGDRAGRQPGVRSDRRALRGLRPAREARSGDREAGPAHVRGAGGAKARAQAEEAHRKLQRAQTLAEQDLISKADLDAAVTAAKAGRAAVASANG